MKSLQLLLHKIVLKFRFSSYNYNPFMSQTIDTSINQMSEQSSNKDMIESGSKIEDIEGEQPLTKRLKCDDNHSSEEAVKEEVVSDKKSQFKRIKLRKWVCLLSYCGQNYYGMQRQTLYDFSILSSITYFYVSLTETTTSRQ